MVIDLRFNVDDKIYVASLNGVSQRKINRIVITGTNRLQYYYDIEILGLIQVDSERLQAKEQDAIKVYEKMQEDFKSRYVEVCDD